MKKSIGNFLLEGWTPTPLEQALMDGTIDEYLAVAANPDDEKIPSDFLEVQEFGEAMEEVKAELEDDINASEIFAERFEQLSVEEVKAMYRVYMLTPYSACFYQPFFLLRKVDGSFVSLPEQLPLEELQEALRWRYHFSEKQVIVSEVMGKPRIHVLAADNSDDDQWQEANNLAVIKEEVAQWGYSVSDISEQMTFHNIPFSHIVLESQDESPEEPTT